MGILITDLTDEQRAHEMAVLDRAAASQNQCTVTIRPRYRSAQTERIAGEIEYRRFEQRPNVRRHHDGVLEIPVDN